MISDIPLLPAMNASQGKRYDNFVIHWLNNKELHFTKQAECLLSEMNKKCGMTTGGDTSATDTDETEHTATETTTEEEESTADRNHVVHKPKSMYTVSLLDLDSQNVRYGSHANTTLFCSGSSSSAPSVIEAEYKCHVHR